MAVEAGADAAAAAGAADVLSRGSDDQFLRPEDIVMVDIATPAAAEVEAALRGRQKTVVSKGVLAHSLRHATNQIRTLADVRRAGAEGAGGGYHARRRRGGGGGVCACRS